MGSIILKVDWVFLPAYREGVLRYTGYGVVWLLDNDTDELCQAVILNKHLRKYSWRGYSPLIIAFQYLIVLPMCLARLKYYLGI